MALFYGSVGGRADVGFRVSIFGPDFARAAFVPPGTPLAEINPILSSAGFYDAGSPFALFALTVIYSIREGLTSGHRVRVNLVSDS